jgi:hypothetical protein
MTQEALDAHKKSRAYKRRLKDLAQPQYNKEVAEWGAGKTKEVLPPAHPGLPAPKKSEAPASVGHVYIPPTKRLGGG